ncbi:helix-hairpin-helix domain-containing protein [candidate division NPL-UPA2 bacterium]|nr:helix-hairpin-helix domain-containing protein [candidate division NPL-UPA2 bacterium]
MFNLTRQEQIVVIFLIGAIILGGGKLYYRNVIQERVKPEIIEEEDIPEAQIIVDIAGAVWRPGVYTLKPGARVKDLVDKASPRGDANLEILNLAAPLRDGQKIVVPTKPKRVVPGKDSRGEISPLPPSQQERKINLNTATLTELETLPGIGPVRAQAIINYREQHNGFKNIEEIKNIRGIGEITFRKIKELIVIY